MATSTGQTTAVTKLDLQKQNHRANRHADKVEKQLSTIIKALERVNARLDAMEAKLTPPTSTDSDDANGE